MIRGSLPDGGWARATSSPSPRRKKDLGASGAAGAEPTRVPGGRSGTREPRLRRRAGSGAVTAFLRPGLILSVLVILVVIGWALVPTWFTSVDPITGVPAEKFTSPGAAHRFGTDVTGRDLYARTVHGAGLSLQATVIAVAIAMFVGTTIGRLSSAPPRHL
ncbi:hypothetical protein OCAE111667_11315 [Occultella aeris]|uniref:Putative D,D-dipeptide transport system permease protein DdpC n=1 Tax=Occultella aeris TaxID=2761496 RepID=A0A7M4DPL8_9MICO|nr:hypothetical protein [Occultella aeris]VZO39412.1 putative D,D-dipeptide transport system permease protein DdpC [Occultella aeris]